MAAAAAQEKASSSCAATRVPHRRIGHNCIAGHCGTPGGVDKGPTATNQGNGVGGAGGADVGNHSGATH
ncbi:hypothetical protein FZI93_18525 [Mycobacterium sp. CBMA361]|uniref:hypothetical protein n=1 Tax=unclassified Mycolicibacterium TaxID=2636767 RepID=UPI0012DD4B4E|nr:MULTISPECIES: hypothetical protein [unclassified Mycolicibacterium]MUM33589.1 hypothetical protein [Mycolicibacterium sp. CBMA 361]